MAQEVSALTTITPVTQRRRDLRREEIAAALRAEWRMIASATLRPCADAEGFVAELVLDPIVVKGSLEQQGYPRTPDALARLEARRLDAIAACVGAVNRRLPPSQAIRDFQVVGFPPRERASGS